MRQLYHCLFLILYVVAPFFTDTAIAQNENDQIVEEIDGTSLSTGYFHTCAIEAIPGKDFGGPIICWGDDISGAASPPPRDMHFIQISASSSSTCGIKVDGSVFCFGLLQNAEFPNGEFLQIGTAQFYGCGIQNDRKIVCWTSSILRDQVDNSVFSPPDGEFYQVSVSNEYACALKYDGTPVCWGKLPKNKRNVQLVTSPPEGVKFRQISTSDQKHACGITLEYEVICWGVDNYGVISKKMAGKFLKVSTKENTTCGIREDRSIQCWGTGLILSDTREHHPSKDKAYYEFSIGFQHFCAVNEESEIDCWATDPFYRDFPQGTIVA